jgi:hypothetical protein
MFFALALLGLGAGAILASSGASESNQARSNESRATRTTTSNPPPPSRASRPAAVPLKRSAARSASRKQKPVKPATPSAKNATFEHPFGVAPNVANQTRIPGVEIKASFISRQQADFLRDLRHHTPMTIPITVTSGGARGVSAQTEVMMKKIRQGEALGVSRGGVYNDVVEHRLMALPFTKEAWAPEVRNLYLSGALPRGHVDDDAIDVSIKKLSPSQRDVLLNKAKEVGGSPIIEKKPSLHMHIRIPGGR